MLNHLQKDHPRFCPGANTFAPGTPPRKMPIRLNSYEKILSLIGSDQGYPEVMLEMYAKLAKGDKSNKQ